MIDDGYTGGRRVPERPFCRPGAPACPCPFCNGGMSAMQCYRDRVAARDRILDEMIAELETIEIESQVEIVAHISGATARYRRRR